MEVEDQVMAISESQRNELTRMREEAVMMQLEKSNWLIFYSRNRCNVSRWNAIRDSAHLHSSRVLCNIRQRNGSAPCGAKGQNRRTLRMLAELLIMTHHAIGRLHMSSGESNSVQELQVKCNLAATLTAEARRLVSAIEALRSDIESDRRVSDAPKQKNGRGAKIKLASNGD